MNDLHINPSKNTPKIDFYTNGNMILSGSVYSENAKEFFDPVIKWIVELEVEEVNFDSDYSKIKLSYFLSINEASK